MKILIAEDDLTSRRVLEAVLKKSGYEVISVADGNRAWEALNGDDSPRIAVLDWMMPGMDGIEVCRRVRESNLDTPPYMIMLTTRDDKSDIIAGLDAGANDYVLKPFDSDELRARIKVGERVVQLQSDLAEQVSSLREAMSHIKTLQGIIPICMHCHKMRNDDQSWQKIEKYLQDHSDAMLSHSLCPECLEKYYPEYTDKSAGMNKG